MHSRDVTAAAGSADGSISSELLVGSHHKGGGSVGTDGSAGRRLKYDLPQVTNFDFYPLLVSHRTYPGQYFYAHKLKVMTMLTKSVASAEIVHLTEDSHSTISDDELQLSSPIREVRFNGSATVYDDGFSVGKGASSRATKAPTIAAVVTTRNTGTQSLLAEARGGLDGGSGHSISNTLTSRSNFINNNNKSIATMHPLPQQQRQVLPTTVSASLSVSSQPASPLTVANLRKEFFGR